MFYRGEARRFSRDAVLRRHRRLWAWVANSYRLAGFDDDRCVLEGCKAVTRFRDLYDAANELEVIPKQDSNGPGGNRVAFIPSEIRAAAALRRIRAARKTEPAPTPRE